MAYRKSIVTFLDVLGFKEVVCTKSEADIHQLLGSLRTHAKPDDELAQQYEMKFVTFSDSTVRAVPLDSETNTQFPCGLLFHELLNLVHTQCLLLRDGHFLRGALTVGDIHIDQQTIFGPAMVNAYRLESEFAVYPRIVIDPVVFEAIENEPLLIRDEHDVDTEREYFRGLIKQDTDGLYFVDYLAASLSEFDEEGMDVLFFRHHKQLIVDAATAHGKLTRVAAKYLWAANYHNRFIRGLRKKAWKERKLKMSDFLISTEEMPLVYEL